MDPTFLIFALGAIALLWFMSSRTRKQQQKASQFRDSLTAGQEVMTGSGLFGTVVDVEGDVVTLETSPGVTSRWLKPAIAKLVEPPVDDEEYDDEEYDDEEYDDEYDDEYDEDLAEDEDAPAVPDDASSLETPDEDPPRS